MTRFWYLLCVPRGVTRSAVVERQVLSVIAWNWLIDQCHSASTEGILCEYRVKYITRNFICKQLPILAPYWLHVGLHSSCDEGFWLMYSKCIQYKNLEQLLRYFWRWDKPYFCMYLKIWSIYMHVGIHVCMYVCNICPSVCLSVLPSTHPPSNNLSSTIQTSIHLFIRVPQSRSVQHLFENHDYKIMWSMAITQPSLQRPWA